MASDDTDDQLLLKKCTSAPELTANEHVWTNDNVLSTGGFPLTTVLTVKNTHGCVCGTRAKHRDLFTFNRSIGKDVFQGKYKSPAVNVCWNSIDLFENKLPRELTGLKYRPFLKKISSMKVVLDILQKGTYWFPNIRKDVRSLYRLISLLSGNYYIEGMTHDLNNLPDCTTAGIGRFKQLLATVDGVTTSLILAFPDDPMIQSWKYYDQMSRCLIKNLLTDYSMYHTSEYFSYYEKIKALRGSIKEVCFHETRNPGEIRVPPEMSFYRRPISLLRDKNTITMFRVSILIQTRSAGTPPEHMIAKSYEEFKKTLTSAPAEVHYPNRIMTSITEEFAKLELEGKNLPYEISKILKRAKVSLSDSAELNTTRQDGGKYEGFRKIASSIRGKKIRYINLNKFAYTGEFVPDDLEHLGERVFYYTLGKVLQEDGNSEIFDVRAEPVLEQGKVRFITVSHVMHAILLHPYGHILLDVLKLFPSSKAGIGAANHAFEFHKRLNPRNPRANFIFEDLKRELFVGSTDLKTATDSCEFKVTQSVLIAANNCIGMPKAYGAFCIRLLTTKRRVHYKGEMFTTQKGCLMGDPATKGVMHLIHISASGLAKQFYREVVIGNKYHDKIIKK